MLTLVIVTTASGKEIETPSFEQPKLTANDSGQELNPGEDTALTGRVRERSHDVPSFEDIVRTYHRDVRLFVARFLGNDPAVDDVAQEVFVQVHRSLSQFHGRSSLKTWILGVARHRVGTWFRQQSRRLRTCSLDVDTDLVQYRWEKFQDGDESATGVKGSSEFDADVELELLRNCMMKLKPTQRSLIQSFYFEEATAESISRDQGRSAGAVRMSLLRIREALAKCIRQQATRRFHDE
ncbi:MAG: sigma-70 family RNA polymerase sigma factor [Pirellula sp.]|nr:sigma-70 family RNA polymerase sigma factor [Pirellula sp.]